jgi:hypothetical protein
VTASACGANPGDVCCSATGGPTCVRGNCCIDVDCSIRGTGFKCLKNNCTGCSPGAGTTLFVDPVYGSDSTGVGVNSYGCAFKTITRALQASGNLPSVTIAVLPTGAVGAKSTETFPIMPRPNATITGSGGQVTVLVPASTTGFALDSPSVSLQQMVVDGQAQTAVSGVRVASSAILKDLTVRSFASDGILLTGGDLILGGLFSTIDNGTKAQRASGVRITGGQLKVNLPSIGQGTVRLEHNQADGIHVTDFGSVQIQGKATSSTTGSVLLNSNQGSGLYIEQVGKTANLPCSVAGLVASSNQIDGIQVFGGSSLTLRQSVLLGNGNAGVEVKTAVVGSTRTNDISEIDLGKDPSNPGQTWGQNTLQGSAGESPNVGAGICLKIDLAAGQVLSAMGNIFTNAIDCSANKPGMILKRSDSCTNAADLSIYVSPPMAPTTNGMEVKNCH